MTLNCKVIAVNLVSLHDFHVFQNTRLNKAYFLRKTYWLGATLAQNDLIYEPEIKLIFGEPVFNDFQEYIANPSNAN
jgi:hypothetical protein